MKSFEDIKNGIFIVGVILIAHFQLVLKIFYTKWDNLSAFFPYRYTSNHFWRLGELPLWDPYQNLGYPMHANPQGYVWYPLTQVFALFGEYSPYFMNLESTMHICIAALGVYFLFKGLKITNWASIIGSVSFGLSGFITGSSHMIGFTIAAAWLPWILLFFLKCLYEDKFSNYLFLAILGMLQLTGSYIAFSIVLVYILVGIIFYKLRTKTIDKPKKTILRLLLISLPVFLLLSAPFLYSIIDSLSYFSRASALIYDLKTFGRNFTFECFQSFLFPYINASKTGFSDVDVSLSSIYVGVLIITSNFAYLFKSKDSAKKILVSVLALFVLLGLGIHTPVHQLFFKYVPGFNLFRHPYLFHLYSTLLIVYMGCKFLSTTTHRHVVDLKNFIQFVILILVTISFIALFFADLSNYQEYFDSVLSLQEKSPLNKYSHVVLQGVILIIIYGIIYTKKNHLKKVILVFFIVEMTISVQLNSPLNMYYNVPSEEIDSHLGSISNQKLTNQSAASPLINLANNTIQSAPGLWVNLNTFRRTTGINGYNPFIFKTLANLSKTIIKDSIAAYGIIKPHSQISNFNIEPNVFRFTIEGPTLKPIHFQQHYHHNWRCEINGISTAIRPNKYGLIEIDCEGLSGEVVLHYDSVILRYLFGASIATMALLLVYFLFLVGTFIQRHRI